MTAEEIRKLVKRLDSSSNEECQEAWERLRDLGPAVVPYLLEAYRSFRKARGRVELVFHSIRYARTSEDAYQLGIIALSDKATLVRYRACMLLAYSLRRDAVPHLKTLLTHADAATVEDAKAAIDAIQSQNHNYFVDRTHTGRSFLSVS
ncbi:MAG: hypothetical protein HUU46_01720 [Candidatus Hydrogenedentes bacterium]|nr:hypothetical protein [Candidatus Hydrogenedentota bacterium]